MAVKRYSTNDRALADAIAGREPFRTSGALRGESTYFVSSMGQLPREFYGSVSRATYIVYSYETPIAWHSDADGWTVPAVKYSLTTTKHQGMLYRIPATDTAVSTPNHRDGYHRVPSSTGGGWAG